MKSKTLQGVELNVITHRDCRRWDPDLLYSQLCTYGEKKDACQVASVSFFFFFFILRKSLLFRKKIRGFLYVYIHKFLLQFDSGGPVLWQNPATKREVLVGVISSGSGCGNNEPGINTRVGAYIDWILRVTSGNYTKYTIRNHLIFRVYLFSYRYPLLQD